MKSKSSAKKITSDEGFSIYYWVNWDKEMKKNFKVLYPGSSMNHSSMENLEKGINERGFPTLVLDPRGFGYSESLPKSEYFSLDKYSNDLRKIIEQEGLEKPSYIGHSFGFMPIVDYVAQTSNAEDITGICASYRFSDTVQNKFLFHLFNRVLRYSEYAGSIGTQIMHLLKGDKREYSDQSKLDGKTDFDVWISIVDAPSKDLKIHSVSGIEINKWDISEQLQKIENPVLLIYGTNDMMVKAYAGEHISSLVKGNTDIEILEGTHSLPVNQSKRILKILDKYLH